MKKKYILNYPIRSIHFSILLLLFFLCVDLPIKGADAKTKEEDIAMHKHSRGGRTDTIPWFNRAMIGVNIFEPIAYWAGQTYWSSGVVLRADIKETFLPVLEFGIGGANNTNSAGVNYKSNKNFYTSFGIDVRATGEPESGCLYLGFRVGYALTNYSIYNVKISNAFWGDNMGCNIMEQRTHATFLHLQIGLKARMYKSLYMGWDLRYGFLLNSSKTKYAKAYYVPGFGVENGGGTLSFAYTIYFKLPIRPSAKPRPKEKTEQKIVLPKNTEKI